MLNLTTSLNASGFSRTVGDAFGDVVAGVQRINARRVSSRPAQQIALVATETSKHEGRCDAAIPALASGFAYLAWRS